eukprot:m.331091 g.331091  ORF g.331091 m.331091 type:complete len:156 (-) comp16640_c0_seq1:152-619(-)
MGFEVPRDRVGIALSVCAAIGWVVFTAGFGEQEKDDGSFKKGGDFKFNKSLFPYYGLSILGLFGILSLFVYSGTRGRVIGVFAMFFNCFMLICAGGILMEIGSRINNCKSVEACASKVKPYEQAEFAGAFLYAIFQTISLCVFFYRAHDKYDNFA